MKLQVKQDKCIGCGNCVALSESNVFDFNDDGLAECILEDIPEEFEEVAKEAMEECPTEAIVEVKEEEEKK